MAKGEKTKQLWQNATYRRHMKEVHKPMPRNIDALISYCKSNEGRMKTSSRMKGKVAWNKGKRMPQITGENHYNWSGGSKRLERIRFRNMMQKTIFERDNYTCQGCGSRGVTLHADHIKPFAYYPELRLVIDNGRTLCVPCHKKTDTYKGKSKNYKLSELK